MGAVRALRADRTAGIVAVAILVVGGGAVAWRGGTGAVVPRISDVGAWLSSTKQGSVVHANGVSGKPDARVTLRDAQGHPLRVTQDGATVLVSDTVTGVVSRIDPAQLTVTQSVDYDAAGKEIVTGSGLAYLIDPEHGAVQRIDLTDLSAVGEPVQLNKKLGAGGIDGEGTLWVPVPDSGALVPIANGATGTSVKVGQPGDVLSLTIAKGSPVATNATRGSMTVVSRSGGRLTVNLPSPAGAAATPRRVLAPPATDGPLVPLVVGGTGELVLVDTVTATPSSVTLAGVAGHELGTPAVLGDRIYVPDNSTGTLLVYDAAADQLLDQITVNDRPSKLELFVKDGLLWVNDADGPEAIAIDASGKVHRIGKYEEKLAGSRPPTPSAPPVERPAVNQPRVERPKVERPKVEPPTVERPTVEQRPREQPTAAQPEPPPAEPAPSPKPVTPSSPKQPAPPPPPPPPPPIRPPGSVTQTARAGSILVTFTPVSTAGVRDYTLSGEPGSARVTPNRVPASGAPYTFTVTNLSCGSTYRFSVTANYPTGSASTRAAAAVRPCVAPDAPRNLRLDTGTQHQIGVAWDAPASDGGGTVHYDVSWGGDQHPDLTRTSDTITGLANFRSYTVTVTAVNLAGSSQPPASKSATLSGGPWPGNVWNPLYPLIVRQQASTGSAIVHTFPAGSSDAVNVACVVDGSSWVDPTGTPSGSTWYRVTGQVTGYIASGYVRTSSEVWDGPCS